MRSVRAWARRQGRSSRDGAKTVEVSGNAVAAHVTSFTWSAAPRRAPLGCPSMRMARSYSIVRAVWLRRRGCLPLTCSLLKGAVGRQGRGVRGCAWVEGGVPNRTAHMHGRIRAAGYSPETLEEAVAGSSEPRRVGTPCRAAGALFRGRQRARRPSFPIEWKNRDRAEGGRCGPVHT